MRLSCLLGVEIGGIAMTYLLALHYLTATFLLPGKHLTHQCSSVWDEYFITQQSYK
jgi:hypothetical protein